MLAIIALCAQSIAAAQIMGASTTERHVRPTPFDENAAQYSLTEATGPVAKLEQRLRRREIHLEYEPNHGFLLPILQALSIPRSSQILVFSKTSEQRDHISPRTPRAIYFNDLVSVAWVPGASSLELAAADPQLGAVFYTIPQTPNAPIQIERNDRCLECHTSVKNLSVPGFIIRSVPTNQRGSAEIGRGLSYVTHRTPLDQRWGGWYVCGSHGNQTHLGNLIGPADFQRQLKEPNFRGNILELSSLIDVGSYPEKTSDIVALMVFEHQCHMHNLITRLRQDAYSALDREQAVGEHPRLRGLADAFLRYLLFIDEPPLTAPIRGASNFASWFEAQGPRDRQGRSLRQLDLRTRLFKFPCSYLIYSDEFESIPRTMKLHVYRRLWKILNGEETDPAFQNIPDETRAAILEILIDTKRALPIYWTM